MSTNSKPIDEEVLADHQELKKCYENYKSSGDLKWYNQFVFELCRHSVGEEIILYPLLDSFGEEGRNLANESRNEHHKVKEILSSMESLYGDDPGSTFNVHFEDLMKALTEHMEKEETREIPMIKERCGHEDRVNYGNQFMNRKKIAPTRPHPFVPETPVLLEEAMALLIAPIDRFRDLFRTYPSSGETTQ